MSNRPPLLNAQNLLLDGVAAQLRKTTSQAAVFGPKTC